MEVGICTYFQHPDFLDEKDGEPIGVSDAEIYRNELQIIGDAEQLGFDSVWCVEHHFGGYTMTPDVGAFLSYMAGRTTRIKIGSMVFVLPWHHPVRVAETVSMLDNLSQGRLVLGIGRGLGRVEFDGMGVPMAESRERFVEAAQLVLNGLEDGYVEFAGEYYQQEKRWLRPVPTASFRHRTYAAAVSPESMRIMAELGVGILIIPQKPWPTVIDELDKYREMYLDANGVPAPPTIVASMVFCDEDAARADEMGAEHMMKYYATVMKHYDLAGTHFADTKGYEYYDAASVENRRRGEDQAARFYADLQVRGTPDQCVDQIAEIKEMLGCQTFVGIFSYSGLSLDESLRNRDLFVSKVQPRIKAL